MKLLEVIFWVCAAGVAYAYVGYPLLLLVASRLRPHPVRRAPGARPPSVSMIVAAYNEEGRIAGRRDELAAMIRSEGLEGEVLIVSDGSTDRTAAAAPEGAAPCVRV